MEKQRCIICRKTLNDGIIINGRILCKACENRLINAKVNTDFYNYYRDCIKKTVVDLLLREKRLSSHM
ncbi:sigma factor G inhibitor Gin [Clostridium thermarum]|uniref:sigma factor G inhibitor Gin n=1 Tax=Clostridium thermarum TaxID=1716543 RepID=UPI0013D48B09|nr:sigma factor G inhibitor Gin [Clostridium thermarum]